MNRTFNDVLECYDYIGEFLLRHAPEPAERIVLEFEIEELDSVWETCIYYNPLKSPKKERQFEISDTRLSKCFFQLARLTSTPEKGLYKKCTYTLFHDGKYTVAFEYA